MKQSKRQQNYKKFDIHQTLAAPTEADKQSKPVLDPELEQSPKKRFTWKRAFLLLFIIILIPVLYIGIWDYRNLSHMTAKVFGTSNALGLLTSDQLKEINGRTNILLIGYSVDDPGHGGAELTDSIMILSLNKSNKTGYMLSVPRDLYVSIPDYGRAKINEAYQAGQRSGFSEDSYPKGGIGLLEKVIHDNLGITVQYNAVIDYGAVRAIVDALDGVDVTIASPDPRGIYDPNFKQNEGGPLKLANGPQHIDGPTALRLTRARGSTYGSYGFPLSDFNRTQNQQAVLQSIKAKLDWKLVLDPRTNSKIFDAVGDNVKTDLELSDVLPLYNLFTAVPSDQLRPITLRDIHGVNLLTGYTTPTGQSALIPAAGVSDFSDIKQAIKMLQ